MSEAPVVRLSGAGKRYRLYPSRAGRFLDAIGVAGRLPFTRSRATEFWALRGIDLELPAGRRIGIVGRNGAGKSTLLRLITGHIAPTEGEVEVEGPVESLSEPGGGFHPEFTGAENVRAALTLRGVARDRIEAALGEIAEFTELGEFLERPFGTYSSGMKARLAFAAATSLVAPRVLVVDEVLGAGDAYFVSRCAERMGRLVSGGATVLLVSHALEQVTRLCEEALWLDRGRVVASGPCLEVVKAYQQFTRVLEDRRLRERNWGASRGAPSGELVARFELEGPPGSGADVREVTLVAGSREEPLRLGDAQDAAPGHESRLVVAGWSDARGDGGARWRSLEAGRDTRAAGTVTFVLDPQEAALDHAVEVVYRSRGEGRLRLELSGAAGLPSAWDLPIVRGWARQRFPIGPLAGAAPGSIVTGYRKTVGAAASRWPGEGSLRIQGVRLRGAGGGEQAVFPAGGRLCLEAELSAVHSGEFDLVLGVVFYRRDDGLLVCRFVSEPRRIAMAAGESLCARLTLDPLRLGNAHYVVSTGLYQRLDTSDVDPPIVYDLLDRSHEFVVAGNPPLLDGVFVPEERWSLGEP